MVFQPSVLWYLSKRLGTFSCPKTVGFSKLRFQRRRSELLTLRHDLSAHVYKPESEPYLYPTSQ